MARIRHDAAITGKAGRKPEPETLELYQAHFVEGKPWKVCFEELWLRPGSKPPVPHERTRVMRRLRSALKPTRLRSVYLTRSRPDEFRSRATVQRLPRLKRFYSVPGVRKAWF